MNVVDATICNKGCMLFGGMGYHHLHLAHRPQAHAAAWQRGKYESVLLGKVEEGGKVGAQALHGQVGKGVALLVLLTGGYDAEEAHQARVVQMPYQLGLLRMLCRRPFFRTAPGQYGLVAAYSTQLAPCPSTSPITHLSSCIPLPASANIKGNAALVDHTACSHVFCIMWQSCNFRE